ncbi:photosystem reaction center subunit H [Saccharothrix sp. ALI-22-I]|uniref:DUF2382 domain-containing protein n=1 Tax=Saccharothrix sp. ALI-22-I TaxID=1933778 RepID=UPI00097C86AC|nr:PRC and DUF2382 domain-containing protein [Saccharothrix sp. ALI-22-I]ONI82252.1 photosystem reaction center subunit H [Saccharothrix sp. ALI-22-I]
MTSGITEAMANWVGRTVYDTDGEKIGKVGQLWTDEDDGQASWVTVRTGLFGMNETFVPVQGMHARSDGDLETPFAKAQVKDAPNISPDSGHIDHDQESRLYSHYGLTGGGQTREVGSRHEAVGREPVGRDTSGPTTDDAMTRSEERLRVGTEKREAGRARLRKYVVTDTEQVSVPVTREEVHLEREPITEANRGRAMSGPEISEEEHEVTLHEERPVVDTEAVPVERVRLAKEQVTDTETVSGEVRKERIDADDADDGGRSTRR